MVRRQFPRATAATLAVAPEMVDIRLGYCRSMLSLDTSRFGASNIHDATQILEKLLNYRSGGFRCNVVPFRLGTGQRLRQATQSLACWAVRRRCSRNPR